MSEKIYNIRYYENNAKEEFNETPQSVIKYVNELEKKITRLENEIHDLINKEDESI